MTSANHSAGHGLTETIEGEIKHTRQQYQGLLYLNHILEWHKEKNNAGRDESASLLPNDLTAWSLFPVFFLLYKHTYCIFLLHSFTLWLLLKKSRNWSAIITVGRVLLYHFFTFSHRDPLPCSLPADGFLSPPFCVVIFKSSLMERIEE